MQSVHIRILIMMRSSVYLSTLTRKSGRRLNINIFSGISSEEEILSKPWKEASKVLKCECSKCDLCQQSIESSVMGFFFPLSLDVVFVVAH